MVVNNKTSRFKTFLVAGFVTGLVAVGYNILIFRVFGFYPDFLELFTGEGRFFDLSNPVFLIFVKDFFVGFLLAFLFRSACRNINAHMGWGIFFFILYSVSAFLFFSIGDFILMRSNEGLVILLTLDGFIETIICTIPVRLLSKDCFV
jgi:hypothetical protein